MATVTLGVEQTESELVSIESTRLSEAELAIWNDPDFQKRFIESYIAETEIEPRVTVDEREKMQKILELISSDKMDEALKAVQKQLDRDKAASAVFDFTLANIYFQQADGEELTEEQRKDLLDQAVAAYQAAVEKYPKFRRAWKNLGLIYIRGGEYEKALGVLTQVLALGDNDPLTYGFLGFAYSSVENDLSAESAFRMAVLLDPETLDWKMHLARSLLKQERFAEAAALFGVLIQDEPDRADLWLWQANAYIGLNRPLKAAENYEFVDQLGESTFASLNMLGDIYINEELFEMAVDCYIRAMEKEPGEKVDRAIRSAKVLAARGAMDETRTLVEYIESAKADQMDTSTRKDLLKLRARLAVASGSGEEEVKVLKEIVELDPLDGEALILLGQHSSRTGDMEQAIFYYERAAAIAKFEADALVRHGQLLVGQGKYDEAVSLLQRAQKVKPRENVQKYLDQVSRIAKAH